MSCASGYGRWLMLASATAWPLPCCCLSSVSSTGVHEESQGEVGERSSKEDGDDGVHLRHRSRSLTRGPGTCRITMSYNVIKES